MYEAAFELNVRKSCLRKGEEIIALHEYQRTSVHAGIIHKKTTHMSTMETKSSRIREPENESRVWRGQAENLIVVRGSIEERDVNIVINTGTYVLLNQS